MKTVDKMIDEMLVVFREANAIPVACKVVDKVLRPYLHWMDEAQRDKEDPVEVRSAMIHLVSTMTIEMSNKMGQVTEEGQKVPRDQWLGEFILDLRDELIEELNQLEGTKKPN